MKKVMKIKKEYTFTNNRQIWRIIPTQTDKLVIEERDTEKKEAFFNCVKIDSGKRVFKDLQLNEKYWIGIETVYKDIIYFHEFLKPDMPGHKGIIAFDINSQKISWRRDDYIFLFIYNDKVYCYQLKFEGRNFYTLDFKTGELIDNLGKNAVPINELREKNISNNNIEGCRFPEPFAASSDEDDRIRNILRNYKTERVITGNVEYLLVKNLILFNFHEVTDNGRLRNLFKAIEIDSGKVIFKEVLNDDTKTFVPDSFFLKDNLIFLLKNKVKIIVCLVC
jgi:hypothetical protein